MEPYSHWLQTQERSHVLVSVLDDEQTGPPEERVYAVPPGATAAELRRRIMREQGASAEAPLEITLPEGMPVEDTQLLSALLNPIDTAAGGVNGVEASVLRLRCTMPKLKKQLSPPRPPSPQNRFALVAPPASPVQALNGAGDVEATSNSTASGPPATASGNSISTGPGRGGRRTSPGRNLKQASARGQAETDDADALPLKEYWRSLLGDEISADIRLVAAPAFEGTASERLPAHKLAIARFPFFRRLMVDARRASSTRKRTGSSQDSRDMPNGGRELVVRGVTSGVLKRVLVYVYTDDAAEAVAGSSIRVADLIAAADMFGMPALRQACEDRNIGRQRSTEAGEVGSLAAREKQVEELADENERLRAEVLHLRRSASVTVPAAHEAVRNRSSSPASERPPVPSHPPLAASTPACQPAEGDDGTYAWPSEVVSWEGAAQTIGQELQAQLAEIERLRALCCVSRTARVVNKLQNWRGDNRSLERDAISASRDAVPVDVSSGRCSPPAPGVGTYSPTTGSPTTTVPSSIAAEVTRQVRKLRWDLEKVLKDELRESIQTTIGTDSADGLMPIAQCRNPHGASESSPYKVRREGSPPPKLVVPPNGSLSGATETTESGGSLTVTSLALAAAPQTPTAADATLSMSSSPPVPSQLPTPQRPVPITPIQRAATLQTTCGRIASAPGPNNAWRGATASTVTRRTTPQHGAAPPPSMRQCSVALGSNAGPSRSRSGTPTTLSRSASWRGAQASAPSRNSPSRQRLTSSAAAPTNGCLVSPPMKTSDAYASQLSLPLSTTPSRQPHVVPPIARIHSSGTSSPPPPPATAPPNLKKLMTYPKMTWQCYELAEAQCSHVRSRSGSPIPAEHNANPPSPMPLFAGDAAVKGQVMERVGSPIRPATVPDQSVAASVACTVPSMSGSASRMPSFKFAQVSPT